MLQEIFAEITHSNSASRILTNIWQELSGHLVNYRPTRRDVQLVVERHILQSQIWIFKDVTQDAQRVEAQASKAWYIQ